MSIWKVLNWVAWAVSAFLLLWMLRDFIKVERQARSAKKNPPSDPTPGATDHNSPSDPHDPPTS